MEPDVAMFGQVMTVIVASIALLVVIGLGARVLWRLGSHPKQPLRGLVDDDRMQRLENAVDTIAIEVERISEAQRYLIGLMGESESARNARLPAPDKSGRVITPH